MVRMLSAQSPAQLIKRLLIGDIMYINILGQPMIVIGSVDIALELMDKRSGIYSDRPFSTLDDMLVLLTSVFCIFSQ